MTAQDLWKSTISELSRNQPKESENIRFWLEQIHLSGTDRSGGRLIVNLHAPSPHYADFVNNEFRKSIEQTMTGLLGEPCHLSFQTAPEMSFGSASQNTQTLNNTGGFEQTFNPLAPPRKEDLNGATKPVSAIPTYSQVPNYLGAQSLDPNPAAYRSPYAIRANIDPSLIFANYIVGPSNQFAHASAFSAADTALPGGRANLQFNPLFIYGPPAVGKTHLLHAIGNHVKSKYPDVRICMVSAENFVNEFIFNVQHKSVDQFREKYRFQADLLLIDDVQFIVGKDRSEEEFFHTFNALVEDRKMIVLTSDKAPKEIEGLEERIRTRFEMGMVADIRPPEIETRIAILKAKAEATDVYLPDEVATFLGTYVKDTVRNLHGVLVKLQQLASLTGSEVTLDLAKQVLHQQVPEEGQDYTVEMILNAVCKHFRIKIKDLKGISKAKVFSQPRQITMYLIRRYTSLGYRDIGQIFGKDHSTAVHAFQRVEALLESDMDVKRAVDAIREQL